MWAYRRSLGSLRQRTCIRPNRGGHRTDALRGVNLCWAMTAEAKDAAPAIEGEATISLAEMPPLAAGRRMALVPESGSATLQDMNGRATEHRPRWRLNLVWAIGATLAVAACVWATIYVMRPATDPLASSQHTTVEVVQGEVGSTLALNTVTSWDPLAAGANRASGVITSVPVSPGQIVKAGDVLYTVNLRPVVVAAGAIPAFRTIVDGARGADVAQLQSMLSVLGFYKNAIDGKVEKGTVEAIKKWQKSLDLEVTGVVAVEDVIFIPSLPARVILDEEAMKVGSILMGGESALDILPASPSFVIPVSEAQGSLVPEGARVEVTSPEGERWFGVVSGSLPGEEGQRSLVLNGVDGTSLCGSQCEQIPAVGQVTLRSQVSVVETAEGLVVPSIAIVTDARGRTFVVSKSGKEIEVDVKAVAKGVSLVEGVPEGTRVQLPAGSNAR